MKGWICLTLRLNDSLNVGKQVREMFFGFLTSSIREALNGRYTGVQFLLPFSDGSPVPLQVLFGPTLPARTTGFDGLGHEGASCIPFERLGCFSQETLHSLWF